MATYNITDKRFYVRAISYNWDLNILILQPIDARNKKLLFKLHLPTWSVIAYNNGLAMRDREILILPSLLNVNTLDATIDVPAISANLPSLYALEFNPTERSFTLNRTTGKGRRFTLINQIPLDEYDLDEIDWEEVKAYTIWQGDQYRAWLRDHPEYLTLLPENEQVITNFTNQRRRQTNAGRRERGRGNNRGHIDNRLLGHRGHGLQQRNVLSRGGYGRSAYRGNSYDARYRGGGYRRSGYGSNNYGGRYHSDWRRMYNHRDDNQAAASSNGRFHNTANFANQSRQWNQHSQQGLDRIYGSHHNAWSTNGEFNIANNSNSQPDWQGIYDNNVGNQNHWAAIQQNQQNHWNLQGLQDWRGNYNGHGGGNEQWSANQQFSDVNNYGNQPNEWNNQGRQGYATSRGRWRNGFR